MRIDFSLPFQATASIAKGRRRHRRQWKETESPEKLKSIYRSFSEIDVRSRDDKSNSHVVHPSSSLALPRVKVLSASKDYMNASSSTMKNLPPLKKTHHHRRHRSNRVAEDSSLIPDGMKQNAFASRFRSGHRTDSSEEWLVPRPLRAKPKDLLKLEGPLDLDTTFRTSYDVTAKQVYHSLNKNHSPQRDTHWSQRQIEVQPQVVRIRRSDYRPKTSLKLGGEGFYHTVTRDSFKRFVVVDVNNNDDATSHVDVKDVKVNGNGVVVEEFNLSSLDLTPHKKNGHRPSRSRTRHMSQEAVDCLVLDNDTSQHLKTQQDTKKVAEITVTKEKQSSKLDKDANLQMKTVSQVNTSTDTDKTQKREVAIMTETVNEGTNKESSLKSDKQQTRMSQPRHSSLPRSSRKGTCNKHKNDSQLKFDGCMDFRTTSQSFHAASLSRSHGDLRSPEHLHQHHQPKKRDLFRASDDVAGLGKGIPVVTATTYSSCFRDNLSCPASYLDSKESDYKFRRESGGHSFYCPCRL